MGSFNGHINNGAYFVFFGLRWTYCVLMRYFLGRRETALGRTNPRKFKNTLLFPSSCMPGIPIEAYILMASALFEFTGEFVMGLYKFGLIMNGQHMSILIFFIIASFVAILKEHRVITLPGIDYAVMVLALVVNAFVLYYHTLGKSLMEAELHINYLLLCLVLAASLALEPVFKNSVMVAGVRCLTTSTIGTFMVNIAFILYYPYENAWDPNSVMHVKLTVMILTWHLAGNLIFMFAMASFVVCRVRSMTPSQVCGALDITYSNSSSKWSGDKAGEQDRYLLAQSDDETV